MELLQFFLWTAILGGMAAGVYGLHRLCLWLEARGLLYYLNKKPSSSPMSCLTAVHNALEPQTQHVLHLKHEKRHHTEEAGTDEGGKSADSAPPHPYTTSQRETMNGRTSDA
jgi:hypothetical protein